MAEISIIVPCYNVERYLHRSIESLINQTFKDIEIICINDGSTDKTLKILNAYAMDDNRIKVIDQINKGAGAARNAGIDIAKGKYLMFLDPDDYFEPFACEKAYEAIEKDKTDIVIFGYYNLNNGKKTNSFRANQIHACFIGKDEPDYPLHFFIFQKIYSKAFLDKFNIKVPETLVTAEDIVFHYLFVFNGASFSQIDEKLVVYQQNRIGSITTKNWNCIKTDIVASQLISSTDLYKKQPVELRKRLARQWIGGTIWNYKKFHNPKIGIFLLKDMVKMKKHLESLFTKDEIESIPQYQELKDKIKSIPFEFLKSLIFPKNYREYSECPNQYLEEIGFKKTLEKLNFKNKKILLYGAGKLAQYAIANYDFNKFNIIGISDRGFSIEQLGEKWMNYNIIPLSEIKKQDFDILLVSTKKYQNIINDFKKDSFYKKIKIIPLFKI